MTITMTIHICNFHVLYECVQQFCIYHNIAGMGKRSQKKCQVMHTTSKMSPVKKDYSIHGESLDETESAKYIGVILHKSLRWNNRIDQVAKKANPTRVFSLKEIRQCPRQTK